jgi:hypothetical protein
MTEILLFVLLSLMCLMVLGMLYGERLSLPGFSESLWSTPVTQLWTRMSDGLFEAIDASLEFIATNLSWVVAASAGTAGLLFVVFLLGGGVVADAATFHADSMQPLNAGGVLDRVRPSTASAVQWQTFRPAGPMDQWQPVYSARKSAPIILVRAEFDPSSGIDQAFSRDYLVFGSPELAPVRPRPGRPRVEPGDSVREPPAWQRPRLDVTFRRLGSSVLRSSPGEEVMLTGRLIDHLPDPRFVDHALRGLLQDDWRESRGPDLNDSGVGRPDERLPQSPVSAIRQLESRVRVTPGVNVAEHDVRVDKSAPRQSATGEITIQVTLTNMTTETISGLLVREILPRRTEVRGAEPEGLLRNDVITWLIDDLRPSEELPLRFTILPSVAAREDEEFSFETVTEVSALTAVVSQTEVEPEPFTEDRRRPAPRPERPDPGTPDVRMEITESSADVRAGELTSVRFTLRNVGDAPADGLAIRLNLAPELDHHALQDADELDRIVIVTLRRLLPGETRPFDLEVRPREAGSHECTAELLMGTTQLDLTTFRIEASDDNNPPFEADTVIR